jgi:hypothetical protein
MRISEKQKSSNVKRKPVIKRNPVPKEKLVRKKKRDVLRIWKSMRNDELERRGNKRTYTMYKNKWFIHLMKEATKREHWVTYDIARMKNIRMRIEEEYKIDICYFSAFIYFSTFKFLHWANRSLEYSNFIGFLANESNLVDFANYLGKKHLRWRKQMARWPDDFEKRWGRKTSLKALKIGKYDQHIDTHLMSKRMDKDFKKYLGG